MQGKTVLITGANSGIGYETALDLARKKAQVILLCRTQEKADSTAKKITDATGNKDVLAFAADFSDLDQVKSVGKAVRAQFECLDILINNAGIYQSQRRESTQGFEMVFAVNHLAPFLLTHLLMPSLISAEATRIINVSSSNHYNAKLDVKDLSMKKGFSGLKAYGRSKLANVLFTYELDRRLKANGHLRPSINVLHPGRVQTDIAIKNANLVTSIFWKFRRLSGISAKEGAQTQIYLASSPNVEGISGMYWEKSKQKESSKLSRDKKLAEELWTKSMEMIGIDQFFP